MTGGWLVSYFALWLVAIAGLVIALALLRLLGELYQRIPPSGAAITSTGPDLGEIMPEVTVDSIASVGVGVHLGSTRSRYQLLMYLSPTCSTCQTLGPAIRSVAREFRSTLKVIVIGLGAEDDLAQFVKKVKLADFPVVLATSLPDGYQVESTPYAVVLSSEGSVLAKGLINRREQLVSVVNASLEQASTVDGSLQVEPDSPAKSEFPA